VKAGDLVQMRRRPSVPGLPVGLVLSIEMHNSHAESFCRVLWDDGEIWNSWCYELMKVDDESR